MKKLFSTILVMLLWCNVGFAKIDKNHLVVFQYNNNKYKFEILQYPYYQNFEGLLQGPASFKLTNKKTNKTIFMNEEYFTAPKKSIGKKFELNEPNFTSKDLEIFHQAGNLSGVFKVTSNNNNYYSKDIKTINCNSGGYYTNSLDKEFIHEATDKCLIISIPDKLSVFKILTFFDIDLDGEEEIIILNKNEGQRYFDQFLIFELDGKKHSVFPDSFNNLGTTVNLTKKLISQYGSAGVCCSAYRIYKFDGSQFNLRYIEQRNVDNYRNVDVLECNNNVCKKIRESREIATYTYANGDKYVGEYKDDKYHGQGTYTWANGNKYVGEFKDGKMLGHGTYTWANGDSYVGEYKDSKRNGQGTLTGANGDKYVGEYKDDKRNGQGTYTYADGTVTKGIWKNGKLAYEIGDEVFLNACGNNPQKYHETPLNIKNIIVEVPNQIIKLEKSKYDREFQTLATSTIDVDNKKIDISVSNFRDLTIKNDNGDVLATRKISGASSIYEIKHKSSVVAWGVGWHKQCREFHKDVDFTVLRIFLPVKSNNEVKIDWRVFTINLSQTYKATINSKNLILSDAENIFASYNAANYYYEGSQYYEIDNENGFVAIADYDDLNNKIEINKLNPGKIIITLSKYNEFELLEKYTKENFADIYKDLTENYWWNFYYEWEDYPNVSESYKKLLMDENVYHSDIPPISSEEIANIKKICFSKDNYKDMSELVRNCYYWYSSLVLEPSIK